MKLNAIQAPRKERPLLLLLFLLVAARFAYAAVNPVTGDSVFYSLMSEFLAREGRLPSSEVDVLGRILIHPPMIYALSAVFFKAGDLFGAGRPFMKMLFPLAGSLTILLTYLLARELTGNRRTALASALIFAALPLSLYMSTVIYIDILMAFFVTLNVYLLILAMRKGSTGLWALVAISLVVSALTKQTGVALIAAYIVFSIFGWSKGAMSRRMIFAAMCASAALLLWTAYGYSISNRIFLPPNAEFSMDGRMAVLASLLSVDQLKFMLSDFWLGVPFSYDSVPRFFSIVFGSFSGAASSMALAFWSALSVLFLWGVASGLKKSSKIFQSKERKFLAIFIAFFTAMVLAAPLAGTGIAPYVRYLLPILPLASIYLATGVGDAFFGRLMQASFVLLALAFLAQTGIGAALTEKRVSGWDGCFEMVKRTAQENSIVFYYETPDWLIYHTGLRAYGWDDRTVPADHPSNLSLMRQPRADDFLGYLKSYNVSYVYVDTGQPCTADPNGFYCTKFADSMKQAKNAQKAGNCTNAATGGWGILYRLANASSGQNGGA